MKKFILAGLLLASGQMALAANWVSTGISSDVLKETIEVDYDSISAYHFNSYDKDSYYVTAWVKTDFPTAQELSTGKLFRQAKSLWYVDCLGKRVTWGDTVYYGSNGDVVGSIKKVMSILIHPAIGGIGSGLIRLERMCQNSSVACMILNPNLKANKKN